MSWANDYITIPFVDHGRDPSGCDCYGMVRLILLERCGIVIPSLVDEYESITDLRSLRNTLKEQTNEEHDWIPVVRGSEQEYDVVVLRITGLPIHVGIVTTFGWMLHTIDGTGPTHVQYTKGEWAAPGKVIGFYRHKELCKN